MKNKKGFTLVELVIVIAVIAILAAVLLPTFAGIIARARLNSATQKATGARDEYFSANLDTIDQMKGAEIYVTENGEVYKFVVGDNGALTGGLAGEGVTVPTEAGTTYTDLEVINGATIAMPAPVAAGGCRTR